MKVKFWGVRGSLAVDGKNYEYYGGATPCIEVRTNSGICILLDAGSGLYNFANDAALRNETQNPIIFLTHYHRDHLEGLAFYEQFFKGGLSIYGPLLHGAKGLDELLAPTFDGIRFPVLWESIPNNDLHGFVPGEKFSIGDARIETMPTMHPGGCVAYRITADGMTITYSGDHEIGMHKNCDDLIRFLSNSDVAIVDAAYTKMEHENHKGWGHSNYNQWMEELRNVGNIVFFHHNPKHDDEFLDNKTNKLRANYPNTNFQIAAQGMVITKDGIELPQRKSNKSDDEKICEFCEKIAACADTHSVLSMILKTARTFAKADAGTIFLEQNGKLAFSTAQNDTLFPDSKSNKFFYLNSFINIDKSSIAGYVATTGEELNIKDVYEISGEPFTFNRAFDEHSGYRTKSVLAMPLINSRNQIMGVLQLINATKGEEIVEFADDVQYLIRRLCTVSTMPLENAIMTEDMIMRMIGISALRDPEETASHVWRVGCMAAELYQKWAEDRDIDPEHMLSTKSQLRLAAMLHDAGKVGIPDAILKKPGRLDDDERAIMQQHAYLGASLFKSGKTPIDKMAYDIAMHHHARWDGGGYTGSAEVPSPKGEDIPLFARMTTIVDVYDALISRRVYKDAWDPKDAIEVLQKGAGSQFDPNLVEKFISIQSVIHAIFERYQ